MKNLLNVLAVALVAVSVVACSSKKADDSSMTKNDSSMEKSEQMKPAMSMK